MVVYSLTRVLVVLLSLSRKGFSSSSINFETFVSRPPGSVEVDPTDDPDYGVTWTFMPDGMGFLLVAYLMADEVQPVDVNSVTFNLYTR